MKTMEAKSELMRETISASVVDILNRMTSDWDIGFAGGIQPSTRLIGDLTFESIDMVQFVVAIEEHFMRRDLPFEKLLMVDGRYVDDLRVAEVFDFLCEHLNG